MENNYNKRKLGAIFLKNIFSRNFYSSSFRKAFQARNKIEIEKGNFNLNNNSIINSGKIYTKAKDNGINTPKKIRNQINLQQKSKIK